MDILIVMGIFHSPRLSTAGLISYIDTTNPRCYVSGSANMFDLIDGESYSVGSVAYESSSLKFNGIDQQIQYKDFRNVGTDRTVEIYHKPVDTAGSQKGPIGQGAQFRLYTTSNSLGSFYYSTETTEFDILSIGGEWSNMRNKWNYSVIQIESGSQVRMYSNDLSNVVSDTVTFGLNSSNNTQCVLGNIYNNASYWYDGYIAVVRVYNRFLSETELLTNKLALDSKFNI